MTFATQGHHRTSHITTMTGYWNIWMDRNTSGTHLEHHIRTTQGHHLPMWHIPKQSFQSMALPLLPDTLPDIHFQTKCLLCSSTVCVWAPTHKMPKFPQLTLTQVILQTTLEWHRFLQHIIPVCNMMYCKQMETSTC